MLSFQEWPGTNVIEFTVDGKITRPDYDLLTEKMDAMIQEHGKLRVVELILHMGSMDPSVFWADIKFGPSHMKYFSHVAVVADVKWIEWLTKMSRPFMSAQMKCFHLDELDEARRWIREAAV